MDGKKTCFLLPAAQIRVSRLPHWTGYLTGVPSATPEGGSSDRNGGGNDDSPPSDLTPLPVSAAAAGLHESQRALGRDPRIIDSSSRPGARRGSKLLPLFWRFNPSGGDTLSEDSLLPVSISISS